MARLKLSNYHVASRPFVDQRDAVGRRVVFATRTAQVRVVATSAWDLICDDRIDDLERDVVEDLSRIRLLVREDENELSSILAENNGAIDRNPTLSLVVCPTAACQLGCPYCGQEHSLKWLASHHQDNFLKMTKHRLSKGKYKSIQLCWFGAEPLLGMKVIREFTPRIQALAEANGCTYSSRIITNGLSLTLDKAIELSTRHAVRNFDLTLDGLAEVHNRRRGTKNGRATFDRIFANLTALANCKDLNIEIKLRTNVDSENWQDVPLLIRLLAEAGIHRRIGYYLAPIHSWGNDADKASLEREEFASREIEWMAQMMELGFDVGLIPPRKPIVCFAVQHDSMLVDASGSLFNCTEVPYVPAYKQGEHRTGHVDHGEDRDARRVFGDFNSRVSAGSLPCASCRMLPVCGGACPKGWLEGWQPCPSALDNMPDRLLLAYAASVRAEVAEQAS